jgi:2-methylisocitrate lyase-like PEP mutase family enzyme
MNDIASRRAKFRELHESGCFVIPNPWDAGSARYLQHLGFEALATTSAGFAFSRGLPDSPALVTREMVLAHCSEIVNATDLPVNADFQNGYADAPEGVFESVKLCVATGVAGLSIEDATGDAARPLYELPLAVERIRAARAAIGDSGVLLTARAECFLVGHPDALSESIRRLKAYAEAGADVLYAPGPTETDAIKAIVSAASPRPVNFLAGANSPRVADIARLGVRRISVGAALARAAWAGFLAAARGLAAEGRFDGLAGAVAFGELDSFFAAFERRS